MSALVLSALAMHTGGSRVVGLRGRAHIHSSAMGVPATQAQGFVQTEMRKAAMALHTRDQSKEGKEAAQKPMMQWTPTRKGYLQFLVDSRHVYGAVEEIVNERAELAALRNTGLERTAALDKDIAWMVSEGCEPTVPSAAATGYAAELKSLSTPAFVCHYYNYYFAHTAGGRMIGKQMSDMLLDGRVLEFYKWDGDVKEMLNAARQHIDDMAAAWSQDERDACVAQTAASFKGAGGMMASLRS